LINIPRPLGRSLPIQALLEAGVLWRASRLASGVVQALFEGLHDTVTWQGDRLRGGRPVQLPRNAVRGGADSRPERDGVARARKMAAPYQPTIIYPVRGGRHLVETGRPPSADALGALVGRTRVQLLAALGAPRTTSGLAGSSR
jgi:hypothetical protein